MGYVYVQFYLKNKILYKRRVRKNLMNTNERNNFYR